MKWPGPHAAKALSWGPLALFLHFPLSPDPLFAGAGYRVHVGLLGVLLQGEDLSFRHHITGLHRFLEVVHTSKSIIGVIITIFNKPAASSNRLDKLGIGSVLQIPGVEAAKALKAPKLVTLVDICSHLTEEGVNVTETLSGVDQTDVMVPTGENRIEQHGINVTLKVPAVHLDREFIAQAEGNSKSIILIVNDFISLCSQDNLLQGNKTLVGNIQINIRNYLHALRHKLFPAPAPNCFTIISVIPFYNPMDSGKGFTFTKETSVGNELTTGTQIIFLMAVILNKIPNTIKDNVTRMSNGTTNSREHVQDNGCQDQADYIEL